MSDVTIPVNYSKSRTAQHQIFVQQKIEAKKRKCEICGNEIFKVSHRDIDRKTGEVVGDWITVWANYYTCCENCRSIRNTKIKAKGDDTESAISYQK